MDMTEMYDANGLTPVIIKKCQGWQFPLGMSKHRLNFD